MYFKHIWVKKNFCSSQKDTSAYHFPSFLDKLRGLQQVFSVCHAVITHSQTEQVASGRHSPLPQLQDSLITWKIKTPSTNYWLAWTKVNCRHCCFFFCFLPMPFIIFTSMALISATAESKALQNIRGI